MPSTWVGAMRRRPATSTACPLLASISSTARCICIVFSRHHGGREQRQRRGYGCEQIVMLGQLGRDLADMDRPLPGVDRFATIERVLQLCAEHRIGKVVDQEDSAK